MKVSFKSYPEYYSKELLGIKSNTMRRSDGGKRFKLLDKFIKMPYDLSVEIVNTKTGKCFNRYITDVTLYEGWYIISW